MIGNSTPSITSVKVEEGKYKRIDIRLEDTKSIDGLVSQTDDFFDNTLELKGNFSYDGILRFQTKI